MRFLIKSLWMTFFVSVATALYVLCCTTSGLIFDIRYVATFLPGTLQFEKISGTLLSGFTLEALHYRTEDIDVTARLLTLHWYPQQLLRGKWAIDSLILDQPKITILSSDKTSSDFSLDDLAFLHRVSINTLTITALSIQKEKTRLDITGELDKQWNFQWKVFIPTLKNLCDDCSGSLMGSGSIVGERLIPVVNASLQGNQLVMSNQKIGSLTSTAHLVLKPNTDSTIHLIATQLNINDNAIKKIALTLSGTMAYEKKTLVSKMQIAFDDKPALFLNAALPNFSSLTNPKQEVIASIKLNITDLNALTYLVPEIEHPRGVIQGTLNVSGVLEKPDVTGVLNLTQGHMAIHALGLHLNEIAINAVLDKTRKITMQGSMRSGKGVGQWQGTIDLNDSHFPVSIALKGDNMTVVHIPKFKIAASPDLVLSYVYPAMEIQGKILITKAVIKLKNYINTVSLPDETVFVGQTESTTPSLLSATKLRLAIDLGNDVYFDYKDFVTHLKGQLVIAQSPNSPATATGEIQTVEGQYSLYGQPLVIKTGRLIYTGNLLTNPGLNIEAIRTVKSVDSANSAIMQSLESYAGTDTTVGVRISGTAANPQVALFSIPGGLTQAQILSALGGGGAALMSAISALNPGASKMDGMTNKLTKMLGLTEVNISSIQTFNPATNQMESTPSFVVGKQISKKLSLHYSIGIFNPISIFNVRYQINKHWAIQSETSTIDNGADVLYGFESS